MFFAGCYAGLFVQIMILFQYVTKNWLTSDNSHRTASITAKEQPGTATITGCSSHNSQPGWRTFFPVMSKSAAENRMASRPLPLSHISPER
jgi:hypothetical protein